MTTLAHRSLTKFHVKPKPSVLVRLGETLSIWARRIRQRRQLAELSDRELHDFGANRADVMAELARPFWHAPPPC